MLVSRCELIVNLNPLSVFNMLHGN